ncbi:ABC transporter permease [Piscinibacter sakaiensis]|uniref:ABC transporter permease n=1 Tax=Piscinibacter sakaiensis TaxID=1547922 RepID=UPI003AABDB61
MKQTPKTVSNGHHGADRLSALRPLRAFCGLVGEAAQTQFRKLFELAAVVAGVLTAAAQPGTWRPALRRSLARQIISSGVEASALIAFLAVAFGILLVAQYQLWLGGVVQSRWLGPVLNAVLVRELGPVLVNLILIARSGSTMASELALVHVSGEDRVAEGQGLDPVGYFVVPRVLALVISAICLTTLLVAFSFLTVYIVGRWVSVNTGSFQEFAHLTLSALTAADVVSLLLKTTIPPLLTGCICCLEGFGAEDTHAGVPRAARIAVQRSVVASFAVISGISIWAYL